jgi:hypothetical protein
VGADSGEYLRSVTSMLKTCDDAGVEVNYKKLVLPTDNIEFLGIMLDTQNMDELSTTVLKLHYKVRLSQAACDDILWWIRCVDQWNKRSVFLDDLWSSSEDICMYTDASMLGVVGVFQDMWFSLAFNVDQQKLSIT